MYDPGSLYFDPLLTDFATGWSPQNLYGETFFPITPVNTKSGRYRVFDRSHWLIYPDRREPGTVANEIRGRKWSEDTFKTIQRSLQAAVHDEEERAANSLGGVNNPAFGGALQINPAEDATTAVKTSISLGHEKRVADTVRNTANYAGDHVVTNAGTSRWDVYTFVTAGDPYSIVSDPVGQIRAGVRKIKAKIGQAPNVLAIPEFGLEYIENHPRVVTRFQGFSLTEPDAFRKLTGFEGRIVVVDSKYNAAQNIDAAESITSLWGTDVWLGYVDPNANTTEGFTFGKTFSYPFENGELRPVDRWREEGRKSDVVRYSWEYDLKIVSPVAGYIIKTAFN